MFVVKQDGESENLNNEEFYKEYGDKIDPLYFRGAFSKHVISIGKEKLEIIEF